MEELLPEIVDLGVQLTELSRGVLATESDPCDPGPYTVRLIRGWLAQDRRSVNFELVQHLLQKVLTDGEPYFNSDLQGERSTRRLGARMTLTTAVVLPLRYQKRVIGALALVHDEEREPFVSGEKELLVSYAEHAALALARLKGLVSGSRFEAVSAELVADDVREDLVKLRRELRRYKSKWQKTLRGPLREARDRFTREYLKASLRRLEGDLNAVAEEAGVQRKELIKLLHAYKLLAKPSSTSEHKVPRAS